MEANIQTVEALAEIVSKQAGVIAKLYSVVEQLNAVISFEEEIEEVNALAGKYLPKGGGGNE